MQNAIPIDRIVRSARRTISIIIQADGRLIVRAPLRMSDGRIHEFVEGHADWIRRKQDRIQDTPTPLKKEYRNGELFLFMGKEYPLHIRDDAGARLILKEDGFHISKVHQPEARDAFMRWYKMKARSVFTERVAIHAQRNGLGWQKIRISSARTRWGSCSAGGNLSFTWRLVLAPVEVIDYVVIHELVHTKIKNHSNAFWHKLAEIMPDYRLHLSWLKENGRFLSLDGN